MSIYTLELYKTRIRIRKWRMVNQSSVSAYLSAGVKTHDQVSWGPGGLDKSSLEF